MEENKRIGFFKRFIISIKDFEKFQDFATEKLSKAIKYFLMLMILFSIILSAVFTYKFYTINSDLKICLNKMPSFQIKNGILSVDSEEKQEFTDIAGTIDKIIIDSNELTDKKIKEYINDIKMYDFAILFLKDKFVVNISSVNNQIEIEYNSLNEDYGLKDIDKQEIITILSNDKIVYVYIIFFIIVTIYMFIIYSLNILLDVILLALVGYAISRIFGVKLKIKPLYIMSIYTLTLPIILNLIYIVLNVFTGFYIKYFRVMYNSVAIIILVAAILLIKSDLIKRQVELIKILEEQEKVKKELQEEKEKKEEEKKEKDKENEEDKNKKKKNSDKNGETHNDELKPEAES